MPTNLPYYVQDGKRYPRVSAILSILRDPDLEAWAEKVGPMAAKRKASHAEKVGTTLDIMVKRHLSGGAFRWPRQASAEIRQGWKAWLEYDRLYRANVIPGQARVNTTYGYGGEPDLIGHRTLLVADLKATTRLREKHWIQVMAYVPVWYQEAADVWDQATVQLIRLDTFLGTCEVKERLWDRKIWETFLHLKEVYTAWFSAAQTEE